MLRFYCLSGLKLEDLCLVWVLQVQHDSLRLKLDKLRAGHTFADIDGEDDTEVSVGII